MEYMYGNAPAQQTRMSCVSDRVVRTRYAVRASDPVSVRLPEGYAEELRNADAARRMRQAYVEEVAGSCRSVAEVPLLESDGRTETMDFMKAYLRRNDAVVNVKLRGVPFLSRTIVRDEMEVLELLVRDRRLDVNPQDDGQGGITALMEACVVDNAGAVRLLLRREDLDVNAQDDEGRTALYEAAWQGGIDVVRMLLADGRVNVHLLAGEHGWTAVDAALTSCLGAKDADEEEMKSYIAVVRLLVKEYGVGFQRDKMASFLALAN